MTATSNERQPPEVGTPDAVPIDDPQEPGAPRAKALMADGATPLPPSGPAGPRLAESTGHSAHLAAGVALLWVIWHVVSPILHTLVLFALAAVLAFALSGPVDMLTPRTGNRLLSIVAVYLLVGMVIVAGIS